MSQDPWNVVQYERFKNERSEPFHDLLSLIQPMLKPNIIDLGCGTGELTRSLHESFKGATTLGIDSSAAMLAKVPKSVPGLSFATQDIASVESDPAYNLIFSNAALQWVPNHTELFMQLAQALLPGGQIAIQIPKNAAHPSQQVAFDMECEEPFRAYARNEIENNTLAPEVYAALLDKLGFRDIRVSMRIYLHHLESRDAVFEWMKGTFLTGYQRSMPTDIYEHFRVEYRRRLLAKLENTQPHLFTFNRILIHAIKPS